MSKRFSLVRLDKGELTSQGFFKVPATFTRTGVFTYIDSKGKPRRELRHPDDVFAEDSIRSLQMAPLTYLHPKEFVNIDNFKDLSKGYIGDGIGTNDGKYVSGTVLITDKKAIELAQKGTVELSCGYTADMIDETGVYDGMEYDCRQTNIRYNHVAQVPAGRAGPMVKMHLDAGDAIDQDLNPAGEETNMEKIIIDGKEYSVPPEVAAAFKAKDAQIAELKSGDETLDSKMKEKDVELKKAKEDSTSDKKTIDTLQAKCDALEVQIKERKDSAMTPEQVNQAVKERTRIEKVAGSVLGAEMKEDASNLDLMKAVLEKRSIKCDGKSEDYVRAGFDIVAQDASTKEQNHRVLNDKLGAQRKDSDLDLDSARAEQNKHGAEAWKQPLAAGKK